MNWSLVRSIAVQDLRMALRNKAVVVPMAIVSVTFLLIMPLGVAVAMGTVRDADPSRASELLSSFPPHVLHELRGTTASEQLVYLALVHLMAPLFIVLPVMLSSVLAADSFAGERERKTLEYLLHSPATDGELLLGKMVGAWVPAIVLAFVGVTPYLLVANHELAPIDGAFLPNGMWILLLVGVIPGAAALALGISVFISAKVDSFQAAYQAGPLVTFPFMGIMVGQITGGVFLDIKLLAVFSVVLWVLAAAVLLTSRASFQRTKLFGPKRKRERERDDDARNPAA